MTLRVPAERLRDVNRTIEQTAWGGYRTEFYGDSLFTLQRLAQADPMMVRRFREASIKGWGYAFQHPYEVAARILADLPVRVPVSDPVGFGRYQTEVARKLARYPEVPLGHSNPERWSRIQESLIAIGAISRPADLKAFLYDPDTPARNGADRLEIGLAGEDVEGVEHEPDRRMVGAIAQGAQ